MDIAFNVDKAAIREWVDALRSGKYKQTSGTLTKWDPFISQFRHCCLGVICELATDKGVTIRRSVPGSDLFYKYGSERDLGESMPPTAVIEYAGIATADPVSETAWPVIVPDNHRLFPVIAERGYTMATEDGNPILGLADLNDTFGASFLEIADLIEATYLSEESA